MFRKFGGGSPTLWKSKNPHSLDYLRYLQGVLVKNDKINENNKIIVIEALRGITEILIWGDQNDTTVFDFFLERQMFRHFLHIMEQTHVNYVNVQLLQTLNILFENIRNETSLYFLLSNNHVNSIITHNFDFADEEIIAYYISFLKTLSFKLNAKTVHFFFNEASDEFPLFTEPLKFYKHSESMVRIAVRTLTLNIFKINEETLRRFVIRHSRDYFNNVCQEMATQIIEIDIFARSAQNESSNRDRLLILIDVHIDNLHYLNDILCIGNDIMNNLLIDSLHRYLFGPFYLASLASVRVNPQNVLVSRITSLFLLSQFLRIIHETAAVHALLTSLFFGDQNDIRTEWTRTLDKGLHLISVANSYQTYGRISFRTHFIAALHGGHHDDHACFYALLLFYYICQNPGIKKHFLDAALMPFPGSTNKCDSDLEDCFIRIIDNCSLTDTPIRPITLELGCVILRHILICLETDQAFYTTIESSVGKTLHKLTNILKGSLQTEKLFLEMFEDEYYHLQNNEIKIATLSEDPGLYLPPSNTPLSGLPLFKRIPSGNDERIRRSLQFYFITRKFGQDLSGECEQLLPLSTRIEPIAELNDCINLNNSDLLSCIVVTENERLSRFIVTDQFQLILVEPDNRRLGWAIVRFVGLLQDVQVSSTSDSRSLNIVVEDLKRRTQSNRRLTLDAKLIFDDHIRCMAAKQRLIRGRRQSRAFKLGLIAEIFGVHMAQSNVRSESLNPLPTSSIFGGIDSAERIRGSTPGFIQKINSSIISPNNGELSEAIPPDPDVNRIDSNTGKIYHI